MVPLSIMGCPVINSFSLSRNSVTIRFFGSRCGTEFGVGDTYQESAPGKGREPKQEWTGRERGLQCGSDTASASSGWRVGGLWSDSGRSQGPWVMQKWLGPACLVRWSRVAQEMHAPWVRQVFSCCQREVSADHSLHSQAARTSLKGGSGKFISWPFRIYHLHPWGLLCMDVSRVAPSHLQWASSWDII